MDRRILLVGLLVAGCASLPPGVPGTVTADSPTMSTEQMKAELLGRTAEGKVVSGKHSGVTWHEVEQADGSATMTASDGFSDVGRVVYRDGKACGTWGKMNEGKETCYRNLKYGDNQYASYLPDGTIGSLFHVVK